MTNLLSKKAKFVWSDKCQQAFNKLKAILGNTPVLLAPDFNKSFKLAVDVSNIGIGAALLQEDDNCTDHPLSYIVLQDHHLQFLHLQQYEPYLPFLCHLQIYLFFI